MKNFLAIIYLIYFSIFIFPQSQILNPAKIWEAQGYPKGYYPNTMDNLSEDDLILNMYFNPIKERNDEQRLKIEKELPFGKEGAYRITALFFFRIAENPETKKENTDGINFFLNSLRKKTSSLYDATKNEYKTIGGFTITFDEAKKYYKEALKNKLNEFELKFSDSKENESFINMIYQYFFDPIEKNYEVIINYMKKLYKIDLINFSSRIVYLNELSNKFTKRLIDSLIS